MSSLLNQINQTLGDTELNKDGELDRLVDFLDSSENDVNDVNDVNNNMVGGAGGVTLKKGNYMAVNESIFKNIHPYYYKLFKNFNMADMKDNESTKAQADADNAHTKITAAKASIDTLVDSIDKICTRFNTFLTEAFINYLNYCKPTPIEDYEEDDANTAVEEFINSVTAAKASINEADAALNESKTEIVKALESSKKLINGDDGVTTRYRLAKEAQKCIEKIRQSMDDLKPKIETGVKDLHDNCFTKIANVATPGTHYNGEAEQEEEHINAKKLIYEIKELAMKIAGLIDKAEEKAEELKAEEAVKIQGLGEFDKDHKTLEYEVYKTLVNEDANYKEICNKLGLSSNDWFCRTCKGNTSSFNFKEKDYYGNYAIMSDAKNETKCHFCGTKLSLKDQNLETTYKRFFLPSLLAKSIECPLVLDKNFLNYAYYHNVRESTKHYNEALKHLLRDKSQYFFDIGYFELKSEETAFIHYEYKYKHKDEEFKAGDGTFSKNAHFINNMSINIEEANNTHNYKTMFESDRGDILFIIPKHSINTYFERKSPPVDLRLVLLFDKKSEKNITPIKLSKNLRFALLNIKKQYHKYRIKKTEIDKIWKTGIDTEITKPYINQFCDDKRQKLFKENNERIIFKMKNTNREPTDYKAVDSGIIQKNLMGNYSENIAHKDTSYIEEEHKALVGIISLLVKQNITGLFTEYDPKEFIYDKVYRLNDIYEYIEDDYLYKILEKMEKNNLDDKTTFEFHDTAIISSKLFKDILNNYLLEKYKADIPDNHHTKLKDKSNNQVRTIGCTRNNFTDISISEYILLNRKDTLLENEIFPDYPFFYHLLDEGMPSLCITTNENSGNSNKVVPISDNLLYESLKDKHTFRCNAGGLHAQIKDQFENLDQIINHTPTPPPNAYSSPPS